MLLQCNHPRVCRKKYRSITKYAHNSQAQRVFKTAPLYAVTNPEEAAPQSVLDAFTAFFESLWSPSTNPDGSTVQKAGMSYVYDEDGTLIAQTLTGGATTAWGQSARYVYLPTAAGPMPVAAIYGTKHYAIQSDHLNTPRRLIQSDGQVAWQWAYSAFGDEKPTIAKNRFANTDLNQSFGTTAVPAVTFNLRYPGQYFDQETSLHYNYHRSYSATTGRYTQADPIGLDGGWNRFGYVGQNPLSFTDPLGLQTSLQWCYQTPANAATCNEAGMTPIPIRIPPTIIFPDDCNNACKDAIVDAANRYWKLTTKRLPQYESGGTRGRDENHAKSIKELQDALKKAIKKVKLHCNPLPPMLSEWERAANEPIPN
jgi:RHS repeat-associated protein